MSDICFRCEVAVAPGERSFVHSTGRKSHANESTCIAALRRARDADLKAKARKG